MVALDVLFVLGECCRAVGQPPTVYLKSEGELEARPIRIGLDNNRMVHVLEGLDEGEPVLLNPPLGAGGVAPEPAIPDVQIPDAPPKEQPGRKPRGRPGGSRRQ